MLRSNASLRSIITSVIEDYKSVFSFEKAGNYKGVYSMYLGKITGFRLLLIPLDKDEKVVETEDMSVYTITVCVEIMEVSKHYEK